MQHCSNVGMVERAFTALGGLALLVSAVPKRSGALAASGTGLLLRGATGWCPMYAALGHTTAAPHGAGASLDGTHAVRLRRGVTIGAPMEQVYSVLRALQNFPYFSDSVERVELVDEKISSWTVRLPGGRPVMSKVEIISEERNDHIGWRSLPDSHFQHAGSVQFKKAPGERGTEVRVTVSFAPGLLTRALSRMAPDTSSLWLAEFLRRVKMKLETGELASAASQPEKEGAAV